jgi:hypothetical protein
MEANENKKDAAGGAAAGMDEGKVKGLIAEAMRKLAESMAE